MMVVTGFVAFFFFFFFQDRKAGKVDLCVGRLDACMDG